MNRIEQSTLLLKLAERIRKIELYYKANIKELALYYSNPSKYPLFDEKRMKRIAEKRLEGLDSLKKKYEKILNSDCSDKITESELIKRGFTFLEGIGKRIYNKNITKKESVVISQLPPILDAKWMVSLHVFDFQEEGLFSLRKITTVKELDCILDLCEEPEKEKFTGFQNSELQSNKI